MCSFCNGFVANQRCVLSLKILRLESLWYIEEGGRHMMYFLWILGLALFPGSYYLCNVNNKTNIYNI